MFAARGLAVSLSVFALFYLALSLAVCALGQTICSYGEVLSARRRARMLFAWRMLPFFGSVGVTVIFAVPSFLWLEPRAIAEPLGAVPVALGLCGLLLLLAGIVHAARALFRARQVMAFWLSEASVDLSGPVPLLRAAHGLPTLIAAGIFRPKVLLSYGAEFVLTSPELQSALRHELAHVRRRDNLRKLLLRFAAFPGLATLEAAWREAAEMAADDAAVSSAAEALDLASALIKLSRLGPLEAPAELTTALLHSPAESVQARVRRLLAWNEAAEGESPAAARRFAVRYVVTSSLALILAVAALYGPVLLRVHAATEWLVR
jgi:beta-lactamase regulating signal transducer with metallopeptidase domain